MPDSQDEPTSGLLPKLNRFFWGSIRRKRHQVLPSSINDATLC